MKNPPTTDLKLPDPATIVFPVPVTLFYKHHHEDFVLANFKMMAKITNLQHFWQVYNNIDFELYLNQGSFFLCSSESPLWKEDGGTYSFIVGLQTIETNNPKILHPWIDISCALICFLLNNANNDIINKIQGVSITKKRKAFNCKFATRFSDSQPVHLESFSLQLPLYFGNSKFMKNDQRKVQYIDISNTSKTTAANNTSIPDKRKKPPKYPRGQKNKN